MADEFEAIDLRTFRDLNDEEDISGQPAGIRVDQPGKGFCMCGERMWVKASMIREPIFPPGFRAGIVKLGDPRPFRGWKDSWVLRYVCVHCQHHWIDFKLRLTEEDARRLAADGNAMP